ncbi:MAG: glycosyltransferase, partial [Clostridia bacterium]|nr:glycosyltransferase [Clostridia bacterium]
MAKLLSIVVPCYNEQAALPIFFEAITRQADALAQRVRTEVWLIDDGSCDETLRCCKELEQKDERIRYLSFSRNFGKEAAMYAGLQKASGDYVVIMDADLQDPPQMLPKMLEILQSGEYDCVGTRRVTRKGEPPIR